VTCCSLFRFHILVIGGSDERLLRRWINLIFVDWLPQIMIRRGAALILRNERRFEPFRISCGSRGRSRIPLARRSSDFPILSDSDTGFEALVRHSPPNSAQASFMDLCKTPSLAAPAKPSSVSTPARPLAWLSPIRTSCRPIRGSASVCGLWGVAAAAVHVLAQLAADSPSVPAAKQPDSPADRSPK